MKLLRFLGEWALHVLFGLIGAVLGLGSAVRDWFQYRPKWKEIQNDWQDKRDLLKQASALRRERER